MTTQGDGKNTPITGEDEVQTATNTMEGPVPRIESRGPNDPNLVSFIFEEEGSITWVRSGPETEV